MSTKEEMLVKYTEQLEELGEEINEGLLLEITSALGPANHNLDAQAVATSDEKEMERVYTNFVSDELAISDKEKGMEMIAEVAEKMKGQHKKYRAVFYYLLTQMTQ